MVKNKKAAKKSKKTGKKRKAKDIRAKDVRAKDIRPKDIRPKSVKPKTMNISRGRAELITIGWREWAGFPELGVKGIKAKIDTGARTSALHAFDVEFVDKGDVTWVHFKVHPHQRDSHKTVRCKAPLLDERWVRSSNGERQLRPVIETELRLGDSHWPIELTLTSRDSMGFRMLLGRQALRSRTIINPGRSFLLGSE